MQKPSLALRSTHRPSKMQQSAPLLPGPPRPRRAGTRTAAAAVAGLCAVGAIAAVAVIVQGGPAALLQKGMVRLAPVRGMAPMRAVGQARKGADPVYYVPMKQMRAAGVGKKAPLQQMSAGAPVVYYYLPEQHAAAGAPVHKTMLANETDGAAAGGDSDAFVCSVDNIKALSATVQGEWDKCKEHKDYKEPNAGASRRLLGWVWEPDQQGQKKTAMPKHGPSHYHLKLSESDRRFAQHSQLAQHFPSHPAQMLNETGGDGGNATGGGGSGEKSFDDCQKEAAEDACKKISSCKDPVCDNYYNEPEIEALCGICTMAPLGCFANSAEVSDCALSCVSCAQVSGAGLGGLGMRSPPQTAGQGSGVCAAAMARAVSSSTSARSGL